MESAMTLRDVVPTIETQDIVIDAVLAHAPATIWKTLTTAELMGRWMMTPTGFEPTVGTCFTFQTTPAGAWDGVIHCEVLAAVPNERLAYAWQGGHADNAGYGSKLDTVVTWTLSRVPAGTRVRLVHAGFVLPRNDATFQTLSNGWTKSARESGQHRGSSTSDRCAGRPREGEQIAQQRGEENEQRGPARDWTIPDRGRTRCRARVAPLKFFSPESISAPTAPVRPTGYRENPWRCSMFTRFVFPESSLFSEVRRLEQELDELLGGNTSWSSSIRSLPPGTFPAVNVGTTDGQVTLYAFAPGIDPKTLDIQMQQNLLSISGRRDEPAEPGATYYRQERFRGEFRRVLTLPEDVDAEKVEAKYRDGIIEITVKRRESTKPRQIAVH